MTSKYVVVWFTFFVFEQCVLIDRILEVVHYCFNQMLSFLSKIHMHTVFIIRHVFHHAGIFYWLWSCKTKFIAGIVCLPLKIRKRAVKASCEGFCVYKSPRYHLLKEDFRICPLQNLIAPRRVIDAWLQCGSPSCSCDASETWVCWPCILITVAQYGLS